MYVQCIIKIIPNVGAEVKSDLFAFFCPGSLIAKAHRLTSLMGAASVSVVQYLDGVKEAQPIFDADDVNEILPVTVEFVGGGDDAKVEELISYSSDNEKTNSSVEKTDGLPSLEDPSEITFTGARETPLTPTPPFGQPTSTPLLSTPPPPGLSPPLMGHSPSSSSNLGRRDASPQCYDKFESVAKQNFDNILFESEK